MNIFRILSSHDGSINEPNVSSFLAYLLNPNEDHGLSSLFLQEILNDFLILNNKHLSKIKYENRITDLSKYSAYYLNIQPEFTVFLMKDLKKKKRDIDILIEIYENITNKIIYSICIENKITDNSIIKSDTQLDDELSGITNYYKENDLNPDIYLIYITPEPSDISKNSFSKLNYDKKIHLFWNKHENSIYNKMLKIFNMENNAIIDPINNQSTYLIKSFLSFIKTGFISYIEEREKILEKRNYGKPVIDHLKDFSQTLKKENLYQLDDIRDMFSKYVLEKSGVNLKNSTRNAHILLSTVNDKNRIHYHVDKLDDDRKNIFYYPDIENKKIIKLFDPKENFDIKIYYKNFDETEDGL